MIGKIARIYKDKGFCFIRPEGSQPGQEDYFGHRESFVNRSDWLEAEVDMRVTFEPDDEAPKGPRAETIILT